MLVTETKWLQKLQNIVKGLLNVSILVCFVATFSFRRAHQPPLSPSRQLQSTIGYH
jgi:hypothetical protein